MHPASRTIRSYVLRQGRMSSAQNRALEVFWPRFGVDFSTTAIDWHRLFGRDAPRVLEIGFGMGESTAAIAAAQPETDYLGIEVHGPGVGGLLRLIEARQLRNVRVVRHDAVDVLTSMIPENSLAGIHVFFPDPWPKLRHQKRRLLQPAFVQLAACRLTANGYFHVATDWEDYALQILDVLSAETSLRNTVVGFAPRPAHRPLTKFEQRGLKLGHRVWDLVFARR